MSRLHWKSEMKYLKAVADYLTELGYEVEEPDPKHRNLLDVWGFESRPGSKRRRRCFIEIYVVIHRADPGIIGYWMQGDEEPEEAYLDPDPLYGLDTRFLPLCILEGLEPIHSKRRRTG